MSNLIFVYDQKFQDHLTPESHPESPRRLAAIEQALKRSEQLKQLKRLAPRMAEPEELLSVHNADYIEDLENKSRRTEPGGPALQLDAAAETFMSPQSYDTAKLAAGAGLVAVESLVSAKAGSSFVAVRPPGHHALADRAMGFCLFNNVAIAARYAQSKLNKPRILIIDWDVHHGNGTQDMFYNDASVCFISFHQYPFWPPDSGWYTEDGAGEGKGFNINIPLPAGTGDRGYLKAWSAIVDPIARQYKPDLILLSAGYDAHVEDPLGQQMISSAGYFLLTRKLIEMAESIGAKTACFLEGGYNTRSLSEAVVTTMNVLNADDSSARDDLKPFGQKHGALIKAETSDRNQNLVDERIAVLKKHFANYWQSLRS